MSVLTNEQVERVIEDLMTDGIATTPEQVRVIDEAVKHGHLNSWGLHGVVVKGAIERVRFT